jgi:hypothetical protein
MLSSVAKASPAQEFELAEAFSMSVSEVGASQISTSANLKF